MSIVYVCLFRVVSFISTTYTSICDECGIEQLVFFVVDRPFSAAGRRRWVARLLLILIKNMLTLPPSRVFGSIESFDARRHKWSIWKEKLKFFLLANGVADDRQKSMLLSTVSMTALGYVYDLNMPNSLDDAGVTFKTLTDQLREHYGEKTTLLAARHEFNRVTLKEGQSVDEFEAALRTA